MISVLVINCILLILSAMALVMGVSFFVRNRNERGHIQYYILFLGVFSAVWCAMYGCIGITDKLYLAGYLRIVGVFAVDAFLVTEVFLFSGLSNLRRWVLHLIRTVVVLVAIADFTMFSDRRVDTFVRIGNWTTWESNHEMDLARNFHSFFVLLYFLILFSIGIVWAKRNKLRRQKRFITLCFISNFALIFSSLPDTFLPAFGHHAVASSGIGAALLTVVTWYGATQLNSFNIGMGTVSKLFYEYINAGSLVFDMDKSIVMANPYALECAGTDDFRQCTMERLFELEDADEIFKNALEDKYTIRLGGKNNDRVYSVSVNAAKDDYGDPYCFICVFMDVTDEANAIKELEKANNAKTEFLTSISHEIRTPINSMMGFNEMIIRDSNEPEITGYADNAIRASRLLLSIVNDLLDMGQIESGRMNIEEDKYDLGMLLHNIYDMQHLMATEKGLTLDIFVDEMTPRYLMGDEKRIGQIVTNLVSNAVKYTSEGGVSLFAGYENMESGRINLIIRVSDTGIGIHKEDLPYLYDNFSRFDKSANKHIEGSGLGLSVTKSLVGMMGGTIDVDSSYGKGTIFTVTVPQDVLGIELIGNIDDYGAAAVKKNEHVFTAPDASVLIVDDNSMNRMVFRGQVKPLGMIPDEAESGFRMLQMIKEKKYDIIFLDHMMPKMNGEEALRIMKEDSEGINAHTPVIAMTANAGKGAREKYIGMGFDDYIGKPAGAADVCEMLEKYLDESLVIEAGASVKPVRKNHEALPAIEGIDWTLALTNIPDIRDMQDLIRKFCKLCRQDIKELDKYFDACGSGDDSLTEYRVKVHSMKNSAALIGAKPLSEMAKALETAASEQDLDSIRDFHKAFCHDYEAMAQRLCTHYLNEDVISDSSIDTEGLLEKISAMEKAMEEYDTVRLNGIVFELSDLAFEPEALKDSMNEVFASVRNFDLERFGKAVNAAKKILTNG